MGEPVHGLTRASWDRMMDLNAWSFVAVTRDLVPHMVEQRRWPRDRRLRARRRTRAGGDGARTAPEERPAAVGRSAGQGSWPQGVSVNSIAPTIMDTPANRRAMPQADRSTWVPTAVAARTIGFLASDAGGWVHGRRLRRRGVSRARHASASEQHRTVAPSSNGWWTM